MYIIATSVSVQSYKQKSSPQPIHWQIVIYGTNEWSGAELSKVIRKLFLQHISRSS